MTFLEALDVYQAGHAIFFYRESNEDMHYQWFKSQFVNAKTREAVYLSQEDALAKDWQVFKYSEVN